MKNSKFKIKNKIVSEKSKTFIISEIGINHEGNFHKCIKMIDESKKSGADAVKLQTALASNNYVKNSKSFNEFKKTDFSVEELFKLVNYSKKRKLIFISTPGSFSEVDMLFKCKVDGMKISSGSMTNYPLITYASRKAKALIISTGMAYENEIFQALKASRSNKNVAILKCTSLYPPNDNELNLDSIKTYIKKFKKNIIGYSDHKKDFLSCLIAVNNGAKIIEKHFTLDSKKAGKDHHISLEPKIFKNMVEQIRRVESISGKSDIFPSNKEICNRKLFHRCIVAARDIKKGEKFSKENLALKRVNKKNDYGIEPKYLQKLLNKKSLKKISKDKSIKKTFFY